MPMTTRAWESLWMRRAAAWMRANSSRSYSWGRRTQPVKSPPAPSFFCKWLWAMRRRGASAAS